MAGALVTFEGIDQAGKQTQVQRLQQHVQSLGLSCARRQYPDYDTPIGQLIEKSLRDGMAIDARARVMLFAANRWERDAELRRLVRDHALVLVDRYGASKLVYGMAQGYDAAWLENLETGLILPDLTLFLDIPPEESRRRKSADRDGFERDVTLLSKARERYLQLARARNWVVIEGARPEVEVTRAILVAMETRLSTEFPGLAALRS